MKTPENKGGKMIHIQLCHDCHMEIDQGSRLSKAERVEAWEEAHRKTVEWWFLSGILDVGKRKA